jgi:predicted MPP superfamily phosphohydrolase
MNWLKPLQYLFYFLSYLSWGFLLWLGWVFYSGDVYWWWWVALLGCLVFLYARFVEPKMIRVKYLQKGVSGKLLQSEQKEIVRLAFISDLHLGVFKGERFLRRVLDRIALERADLLVLGGDLINDPTIRQLGRMFESLRSVAIPMVAVTGNHDSKKPGDFESEVVRVQLRKVGVKVIDNAVERLELNDGRRFVVVGLSDLMEGKADFELLNSLVAEDFNLLIAHNPDATYQLSENLPVNLVLSGHTHGGQIYLPPFSNWLIPTKYKFVKGWYEVNKRPVYVSSGVGEVVLPMRFLIPPEVVILDLEI